MTKLERIRNVALRNFINKTFYDFDLKAQGTTNKNEYYIIIAELYPGCNKDLDYDVFFEYENEVYNSKAELLMNKYGELVKD